MFRDTYAAIYDQYVVIGSKITVTVTPASTVTAPAIVVLNGDDDASNAVSITGRMEQNNAIHRVLGLPSAGNNIVTLTNTFEPVEKFGIAAKDDGASATAQGSNPTELWCYQLGIQTLDFGTTSSTFYVTVEIDYTVKFTELITRSSD